jgi:hypothetical protein
VTEAEKEQALDQTCISLTTLAKQQVTDIPKKLETVMQGMTKPSFYRQKDRQEAYDNDQDNYSQSGTSSIYGPNSEQSENDNRLC